MPPFNILGIDPSLRNWGVSHCVLTSPSTFRVNHSDLFQSKDDKTVKPNISDLMASYGLYQSIREYASIVRPNVIVIELPIGSQSYSAAVSYGICIGLIGAIKSWGIPVIPVSPYDVKKVIGKKETTKQEIIDWVSQNYPEVQFPMHRSQITVGKAEHIADSIVAVHAALLKPELKGLIHAYYN